MTAYLSAYGGVPFSSGIGRDSARIFFSISFGGTDDIDGDGIPDSVERYGIFDKLGNRVFSSLTLKGDPCRKTIAVEIDFMRDGSHNHRPSDAVLREIREAFAAAPVPAVIPCPYPGYPRAPSGIGIILNVDRAVDEVTPIDWGTGAETVRDNNFAEELRPYFHYSLWVHDLAAGDGSSGHAVGKDFLVSLGTTWIPILTTRIQSGTFMHELGHTLGLEHGGSDTINCKPNYLSVMNYLFQFSGILADSTAPDVDIDGDGRPDVRARLDYSRSPLARLNEVALNEHAGISAGTDVTIWSPDGGAALRWARGNQPINWDGDTTPAPGGGMVPNLELAAAADVNDMAIAVGECAASPGQTLIGHDDWANLKYAAGGSSGGATAVQETFTSASWLRIRESLRVPPTVTYTVSPAPTIHGWNNTDVTVTLTADGPGTISRVRFSTAGAETREITSVDGRVATIRIAKEGITTLTFTASNQFGDSPPESVAVRIDKTEPCPSWPTHLFCEIRPADRRMVRIAEAAGSDELSGIADLSISAVSSEADSGLEADDLPGDVLVQGTSVSVRAEVAPGSRSRSYTFLTTAIDKAGNRTVRPSSCTVYPK